MLGKGFSIKKSNKRKLVSSSASAVFSMAVKEDESNHNNNDGSSPKKRHFVESFEPSNPNVTKAALPIIPLLKSSDDKTIEQKEGTTGSLMDVIKKAETLENDVAQRPEALSVQDSAYDKMPVADFGAALLRGMGWKGKICEEGSATTSKDDSEKIPEPHKVPRQSRLGLGASTKAPEEWKKKKKRKKSSRHR